MNDPALEALSVSKSFGGVAAIADVSFAVASGSITALIGPNGAGKTTLFNVITNLTPATSGTVRLFDRPIGALSAEAIAGLGLIRTFQSARVFPGMTVLENVAVGAHRLMRSSAWRQMLGMSGAWREERALRARARSLLEVAGLLGECHRQATELAMGAQKILEILRALMAGPRVLLLDEPAAGLNDTESADLSAMLRAIRDAGITLLMVEHNMSVVMDLADQVIVLDAGRIVSRGPPAAIRANAAVIAAYVGHDPA